MPMFSAGCACCSGLSDAALLATSQELLRAMQGELHCLCGSVDSLIPKSDQQAIQAAMKAEDHTGLRLRYRVLDGADHGFMGEACDHYHQASAQEGWRLLLAAVQS